MIEDYISCHLEEHGLNLEHVVRVRIIKGLMFAALLAPRINLEQEIFRERQVFDTTWSFGAFLWNHVKLSDVESPALREILADVLIHAPNSIDWVIFIEKDHMVLAFVAANGFVTLPLKCLSVSLGSGLRCRLEGLVTSFSICH